MIAARLAHTSAGPMKGRVVVIKQYHAPLEIQEVVSHKFPLAEVNRAFRTSEWSGQDTPVIRGILVP